MKILLIAILLLPFFASAQEYRGSDAIKKVQGAALVRYTTQSELPAYVAFLPGKEIPLSDMPQWLRRQFSLDAAIDWKLVSSETDRNGIRHERYRQTLGGVEMEHSTLVFHVNNGFVTSFNGVIVPINSQKITAPAVLADLAFNNAVSYVGAEEYRWQNQGWEAHIKELNNDTKATWKPEGHLLYVKNQSDWELAWRFDIYASKPMSRQYVFVSASSGQVIRSDNRLRNTDVTGTAITKYSGTQTITTDQQSASSFRLRETGRGLGIETYDLNNSTDPYSSVDFTDTDNTWNNVNANQDEVATDAHWGAEMVYDYYYERYGRNSINNAGLKLVSYVHYDYNWANAMWDGTGMYYGDGDVGSGITPLTTIDICGHEITHSLTEYTAALIYAEESGALNEAFSDIFGVSIRYYAKPSDFSWQIGDEMGWVIRDMSDPNDYGQPDTYLGNQWDPYQEVHTNSGVGNYWFYLLSHGGSGTNDNGDAYSVTGISIDSAAAIAYRMLTVYLTEASDYADARFYAIIAASDLFGACSPEVIATTNAWYAVGVGLPFNPTVTANFSSIDSVGCSAPHTVNFENLSTTATTFNWQFGDGGSSTQISPSHTYNSVGTFTVTLIADGGTCGKDTIVKSAFVDIDTENPCIVQLPSSGNAPTQTSCSGTLTDAGGDGPYPDNSTSTIVINPAGAAQVTIIFSEFSLEDGWDYLYIYDGSNTSAPLIGQFTGYNLPNGGTITSTGPAMTLRFSSDSYITDEGFRLTWECIVGVDSYDNELVTLYPNPASDMIHVNLPEGGHGSWDIIVYDCKGRQVLSSNTDAEAATFEMNVESLAGGLYHVVLTSDENLYQISFMKE